MSTDNKGLRTNKQDIVCGKLYVEWMHAWQIAFDVTLHNTFTATDEYTRHSVQYVTQPYTGTTADNQLAPQQN